ncbi:pyruvate phosphate dikinase, PEP/pyruvate binding domain-containing protein [Ditylenchus destructor]|nr:pyruvate phosphate dikinase, PEP/pyruvate binding domain-containing protein [Ditylenchus destructor]
MVLQSSIRLLLIDPNGEQLILCLKANNCKASSKPDSTLVRIGHSFVERREAFRRWRIRIQGVAKTSYGIEKNIRLNGWWLCASDPNFLFKNISTYNLAQIATRFQCFPLRNRLNNQPDFSQLGMLRCQLEVQDTLSISEYLDFHGPRIMLGEHAKDSRNISINEIWFDHNIENSQREILYCMPIQSNVLRIKQTIKPNHRVTVSLIEDQPDSTLCGQDEVEMSDEMFVRSGVLFKSETCSQYTLGIRIKHESDEEPSSAPIKTDPSQELHLSISYQSAIFLDEADCVNEGLCGGKAANLAKIIQHCQSHDCSNAPTFKVPRGFVITTSYYEEFLKENVEIREILENLSNCRTKEDLSKFASRIVEVIQNSKDFLHRNSIVQEYVRERIIDCWASNFRCEILNYRFENGISLNIPVAVIVQEMVTDGVAGVLFTSDPVQRNTSKAVINMVQGLGESLVGGHTTPAQVIVDKTTMQICEKNSEDTLLDEGTCQKLVQIGAFLQENIFAGISQDIEFVVKNAPNKEPEIFILQSRCITSLDLESDWELHHEFDTAMFCESDLVTTANITEVLPNVQSPLHISFFNLSLSGRIHDLVQMDRLFGTAISFKHYSCCVAVHRQRSFLNLTEIYLADWEVPERDHIGEYSLAGHKVFTEEMIEAAKKRFPPKSGFTKLYRLFKALKLLYFDSRKLLGKAERLVNESARIKNAIDSSNKSETLAYIEQLQKICDQAMFIHTSESTFSSITYTFVAMLLRGSSEGDLTPEVLSDIALIYSHNPLDVVSADAAKRIENIAKQIFKDGHLREFTSFDEPITAFKWLRSQSNKIETMFRDFFEKHGHRGLNEMDFLGKSWDSDPELLYRTIKAILNKISAEENSTDSAKRNENTKLDVDQILSKLKSKLNATQRFALKLLIPYAHRGVYGREESKNHVVKVAHTLRYAFYHLAKCLMDEVHLPSTDLILFMTFDEIRHIVQNSAHVPTLISRSRRRMRIYESQDSLRYSLLNIGTPAPIKSYDLPRGDESAKRLTGTCVCEGLVRGRVRVARTLNEAQDTQPGEILITQHTDIGWSPLFPILKGLVTEVGGLLSHGAVVARENGLPCLIAVHDATCVFNTGDEVWLNATEGYIQSTNRDACDEERDNLNNIGAID